MDEQRRGALNVTVRLTRAVRGAVRSTPARSGGARLLAMACSSVITLVSTRFVFDHAGVSTYAAMTLVFALFTMFPVADLGTGAAITNAIAESADLDRDERLHATIASSLRILLGATVALTLFSGLIFMSAAVRQSVFGEAGSDIRGFQTGAALAFLCFALAIPFGVGQRLLLGADKNHVAVLTTIVSPIASLGFIITIVAMHGAPGLIVAAPGIGSLCMNASTYASAAMLLPAALLRPMRHVLRIRQTPGTNIWTTAGPMLVISSALALALQSDRVVLSHVSTVTQLAHYSVGSQLYGPLWAVISSTGLALWPMFARARAKRLPSGPLYRRLLAALTGVSALGALALVLAARPLGQLISGGRVDLGIATTSAFAALLLVQGGHLVTGMLLTDPRGLRIQSVTVVGMLVLNLPVSVVLARTLGAGGPVIGSAGAILVAQAIPCLVIAMRRMHRESALARVTVEDPIGAEQ